MKRSFVLSCLGLLWSLPTPAAAVLFYDTADREHNTNAPGEVFGADATLAWNLQGNFGRFLGTPISSRHFITAAHIGGSVGDQITFSAGPNVGSYRTTGFQDLAGTDLRIWEVSTNFAATAPIYTGNGEAGMSLLVFGRGTPRGEVFLDGLGVERGWTWGTADGKMRWGTNTVAGFVQQDGHQLLAATFSSAPGTHATLSDGDSGGSVWVLDDRTWKLAGINYAVEGPYSLTDTSNTFTQASLYDQAGLYYPDGPDEGTGNDEAPDRPGRFYASRLSTRTDWINSAIPEPGSAALALIAAAVGLLRRRC